uniref:Uncharacterized protein n=1 Tax=Triticum urartu TaxID=4572 RepID=A0A8R7V6H5_TRIUA
MVALPQLVSGYLPENHMRPVAVRPHDGHRARVGGYLPDDLHGRRGGVDVAVAAADGSEGGDRLQRDRREGAQAVDEEADDVFPRQAAVLVAAERGRPRPADRLGRGGARRAGDLGRGLVEGREGLLVDGASFREVLADEDSPRPLLHQVHYLYQPGVGLDLADQRRLPRHHLTDRSSHCVRLGASSSGMGGYEGDDVEGAEQPDDGGGEGRQRGGAVAPDGHGGLRRRRDGRGGRGERRGGRHARERRLAGGEVGGCRAEEDDVGHPLRAMLT